MDEKKLLRGFFHRPSRTFAGFAAQLKGQYVLVSCSNKELP
jgi:hypothetical protein